MRIAIVSPYIATSRSPKCYQSQQINLSAELVRLGLQVDIITAKRHPDEPACSSLDEQINIYRLTTVAKSTERFLRQPIMIGLWKQLKRGKYDYIQTSEDYSFSTLIACMYAAFNQSRLIIYQGIYDYASSKILRAVTQIYDLIAGAILRRYYYVAVCKTNLASQYLRKKGYHRTKIIPVGVNTSLFYSHKQVVRKNINLLAVGNLIPLKNYPFLLDVFLKLVEVRRDVCLTIIGSGPERERIERFVLKNGLTKRIQLLENVPNDRMRIYYGQADLLLLFSKIEIFGMVILEAMACGCPVMSTPTPGASDVIIDEVNGFIVSETNPAKVADRITRIFDNPDIFERIRLEAIRTVKEKYSWQVIAEQYYELYFEKAK